MFLKTSSLLIVFLMLLFASMVCVTTNYVNAQSLQALDLSFGEGVTRDLKVNVIMYGESRADHEVWVYNPKGVILDGDKGYFFKQLSSAGYADDLINLGSQSDERAGCVKNIKGKRTGVCEDGFYTAKFKDTDAAGNESDVTTYRIERDTVKPEVPNISELYLCGKNICVKASGENNTSLQTNGQFMGIVSSMEQEFIVLYNWDENTLYTFNFLLQDKALNQSNFIQKQIKSPVLGRGSGGILGSVDNKYGGQNGDSLVENKEDVIFEAIGEFDGNGKLTGYKSFRQLKDLRPPQITYIETGFDKKVNIFGINYYPEQVVGKIRIYPDTDLNPEKLCSTIIDLRGWLNSSSSYEECYGDIAEMKNLEYSKNTIYFDVQVDVAGLELFYKNALFSRNYDEKNDTVDKINGRWMRRTKPEEMKPGEFVKARGQYIFSFNIEGKKSYIPMQRSSEEKKGIVKKLEDMLKSSSILIIRSAISDYLEYAKSHDINLAYLWGNSVKVPEVPKFGDLDIVSPVKGCSPVYFTSAYGHRTFWIIGQGWYSDFHNGVDLSHGSCEIKAAYSGYTYEITGFGNGLRIDHPSGFQTVYGHGAYFNGDIPRDVLTEEYIMKEGKTGFAHGIHLHFELYGNGTRLNPTDHFREYFKYYSEFEEKNFYDPNLSGGITNYY
jgi:murein DD-endopeptidase MepM/ murein hydrolase activator NlpD